MKPAELNRDWYEQLRGEIEANFRATGNVAFRGAEFHYLDLAASRILLAVAIGMRGWVAVVGDGENAAYEWVARADGSPLRYEHSDCGFGCPASALRDGLIAILD